MPDKKANQKKAARLIKEAVPIDTVPIHAGKVIRLYFNAKENVIILTVDHEINTWFPCEF